MKRDKILSFKKEVLRLIGRDLPDLRRRLKIRRRRKIRAKAPIIHISAFGPEGGFAA